MPAIADSSVVSALIYLIRTSGRNRFAGQLRRLKQPKYALALLFGIAYLGFFVWGRMMATSVARAAAPQATNAVTPSLAPLFVAVILGAVWIFGSDLAALAFTRGEIAMLFPAPVSRRALISYKLARMQFPIVFSAALWVFLFRRPIAGVPSIAAFFGYWVLFATLGLHRLGSALVRAQSYEHKPDRPRRNWVRVFISLAVTVFLISQLTPAFAGPDRDASPLALLDAVGRLMATPYMRVMLYPFRLMTAPGSANSLGVWASAMVPAVGILLVHVWWVMYAANAKFEEAAAEVSEQFARRMDQWRQRRSGAEPPRVVTAKSSLRLQSSGRPAIAIFWKNMLALRRSFSPNTIMRPVILSLVVAMAVMRQAADPWQVVAIIAAYMVLMLFFSGPQTVRNDLRSDMVHLPLLKTVPLSGAEIVFAEIASSAIPLAAMQMLLIAIAGIALAISPHDVIVPAWMRAGILIVAPVGLLVANVALLSLSNAVAVLFPGWMKFGPAGAGGFEVIGQVMLTMFGMLLGFAVLLVIPAAAAVGLYFLIGSHGLVLAFVVAGIIAGALLGVEVYAVIRALGIAFERAEPSQVAS